MVQRVLVVGGAGYIGGAVTDELLMRNIPFTVYDNLTYENHYLKPVDFIYGDIRDREKLAGLLPQYSHVIWLAALVGDGACSIRPALTREINQEPVEWLARRYSGRILFTSTCSVYGISADPVTEDSPTNPLSEYAQTKLAAEKCLLDNNALIIRLGTAYGIPDAFSRIRMDLAINYMTANALTKGGLTLLGGSQWRPFIHVKDIGRIIAHQLDAPHTGVFNLTTANATINEIGILIQQETQCRIERAEQQFDDRRNYHANVEKARRANILPTTTDYSLTYGIREIKNLVLSGRINNLEHAFYSNQRYLQQSIEQYDNGFHPIMETQPPSPSMKPPLSSVQLQPQEEPHIVTGELFIDDRGEVAFVNNVHLKNIKRCYRVRNHRPGFVRAWHAHKQEAKYVMVVKGTALVGVVSIDNFHEPNKAISPQRFVLSEHTPSVLYIPPGYANGAMSLEPDTTILYLSTSTVEESKADDYRYDVRYWDIWNTEER